MSRQTQFLRPLAESLEDRFLPSVCTVDRLTDFGEGQGWVGDLRYCIHQARDEDSVQFAVRGTITLDAGELTIAADLTVTGPGAAGLTVSGNQAGRVFHFAAGSTAALSGLTVADGRGLGFGGGILNRGDLTLTDAVIRHSDVIADIGSGCGIYNAGTLTVVRSSISDNADQCFSFGAGVYNEGTLIVTQSTLSDNAGFEGGGIYNEGVLSLTHATLSGNAAFRGGGGIYNHYAGTLRVSDTILASNTAADGPDLLGHLAASGFNLVGDTQGGSGFRRSDLLDIDPRLGPLADNGGPTWTRALLPGSPAIDAGHPKTDREGFDQRGEGFIRVVGRRADIGAFEVQGGGFAGGVSGSGPPAAADLFAALVALARRDHPPVPP